MTHNRLAASVLALTLSASGLMIAQPYETPAAAYAQDRGWDAPPQEFRDIQRQGFHDGVDGARKDYDNHRRADVNNRDEYRHPHVPPSARDDYREGFRRGYETAMDHLMTGAHGR
jgi:hypothetical protein